MAETYNKDGKNSKVNEKTGFFGRLMKHSKKIIVGVIVFAVLVSLSLVGLALYEGNSDVVATLGDKKVTKTEYEDARVKCDGFYKYNFDEEGKKKCSESEIEDQILRKALEIEAEKRGITVTEAEINERYKGLISAYKSEESYKFTIKNAYGWTPEYVKANLKRDILQEKLEPYLISSRDGYGVFVRWDWFTGEPSIEQRKANEAPSRELLEKNLYPLMKSGASKEDLKTEIARLRTLGAPWDGEYNIGLAPFKGLNSQSGNNVGKEDWDAISKLQNSGDITDIVRSSLKQFVVYKLENKTNGSFNSWDDFKKDAASKAKITLVSYKYNQIKNLATSEIKKYTNIVGKALHINNVFATSGISCRWYNFSEFYAYVADGSNTALRLSGVSISASYPPETPSNLICNEETTPHTVTSGSDGGFTVGSMGTDDARYGTYSHAPWALSCYHGWNVDVSKAGYENMRFNRSTAPNGTRIALDRVNEGWESYTGPEGIYRTWNNDGNSYIFMKPSEALGAQDTTDCTNIKGWALDYSNHDYQSTIHIYQTSKNQEWCLIPGSSPPTPDPTCTIGNLTNDTVANQSRPDLASHFSGLTNLNHGFSFATPDTDKSGHSIRDGNDHWIWVYAFKKSDGAPYKLGGTPKKINCSTPAITNSCPTLTATPPTVKQGDPVKLSWSGGAGTISSISIRKDTDSSPFYSSTTQVLSGQIDIVPPNTTNYILDAVFSSGTPTTCSTAPVTVRPAQSGSDRPVPPN